MFAVRKLLIPLIFIALVGSTEAWAAQTIKIEKVAVGTQVKVTRSGSVVRLKEGDFLQSGDELSTDAQTAVDVRLADESLIRVGVNSTYKVEESPKFLTLIHRLITGVVRIQVPKAEKKNADIKFRLYTPEGTIGVRGTEFVVIRTADGTELKGLDGEVLFGPAETEFQEADKFVQVRRGFQSAVKAGGRAAKPEKYNMQEYLREINGRNGAFGPLAGRRQESKSYARRAAETPAPVVAQVPDAPKAAEKKVAAKGNDNAGSKTNWEKVLFDGVLNSDLAKVKLALRNRANVNAVEFGHTPLQIAVMEASSKDKDIMIELLSACADPNVRSKGITLLMFIGKNKLDIEYAKALIEPGGADYRAKDKDGNTAADYAADAGFKELADYLDSEEAEKDYEDAMARKAAQKRCK